jgi:hypothetical protein
VIIASVVYGVAMFVIAVASDFNGFLVGMAVSGLGFGTYVAGALPFSIAPGIAPAILAVGHGSYSVLYGVAGVSAIVGAVAILPVKRVR